MVITTRRRTHVVICGLFLVQVGYSFWFVKMALNTKDLVMGPNFYQTM